MNRRGKQKCLFVSFVCDESKQSVDLTNAMKSYFKLKNSYVGLDPDGQRKFINTANFDVYLSMLALKLNYIKRLAVLENIEITFVQDNNS